MTKNNRTWPILQESWVTAALKYLSIFLYSRKFFLQLIKSNQFDIWHTLWLCCFSLTGWRSMYQWVNGCLWLSDILHSKEWYKMRMSDKTVVKNPVNLIKAAFTVSATSLRLNDFYSESRLIYPQSLCLPYFPPLPEICDLPTNYKQCQIIRDPPTPLLLHCSYQTDRRAATLRSPESFILCVKLLCNL